MPRGLGDNPLKKEKRAKRVRTRGTAAAATGPESLSPASTDVTGPEVTQASSSRSRSYNDVFFQRRPENSGAAPSGAYEELRVDDSGTIAPIAEAEVISPPVLPDVAASASVEPLTSDAVAPEPALASVTIAEPVPQVEAAHESTEPSPVNDVAVTQAVTDTSSHEEAKPGFFGRIFGRLHK